MAVSRTRFVSAWSLPPSGRTGRKGQCLGGRGTKKDLGATVYMTTQVPKVGSVMPSWYLRWAEGPPTTPGPAAAPGKCHVLANSFSDHFSWPMQGPILWPTSTPREGCRLRRCQPSGRGLISQMASSAYDQLLPLSHPPTQRGLGPEKCAHLALSLGFQP